MIHDWSRHRPIGERPGVDYTSRMTPWLVEKADMLHIIDGVTELYYPVAATVAYAWPV